MSKNKVRVHVHLYEQDWIELEVLFGKTIGRAMAVREMIHNNLNTVRAKVAEQANPIGVSHDELAKLSSGLLPGGNQPGHAG